MSGNRHSLRGANGQFAAAGKDAGGGDPGSKGKRARPGDPGSARKRARGDDPGPRRERARGGDPGMELKRARGDWAAGRPQLRRKHKGALTKAEIQLFLATLAETCNLAHSARTVGRETDRIFRDLRKRDPGFAAAWDSAIRDSYDMLELEMNQRLRFGTPKDVFHDGRKVARIKVFHDGLALRLLSLHRKSVEQMRAADSAPRCDVNAKIDLIAARLAEIEAEEAAKKAEEAAKKAEEAEEVKDGGEAGDGGQ
jgi:hypothetical protein